MVTKTHEDNGKILHVVFEKKKSERLNIVQGNHEKCNVEDSDLEKRIRHEYHLYKKRAAEITKATMKKKYAVVRAELDKRKEVKHQKIMAIVNAVKTAHEREDKMTEKFLGDVESLVSRFKVELDKMQKLFGSILSKLPQVSGDETNFTSITS